MTCSECCYNPGPPPRIVSSKLGLTHHSLIRKIPAHIPPGQSDGSKSPLRCPYFLGDSGLCQVDGNEPDRGLWGFRLGFSQLHSENKSFAHWTISLELIVSWAPPPNYTIKDVMIASVFCEAPSWHLESQTGCVDVRPHHVLVVASYAQEAETMLELRPGLLLSRKVAKGLWIFLWSFCSRALILNEILETWIVTWCREYAECEHPGMEWLFGVL